MKVPFIDLRSINARFMDEFADAYRRVVASGWFIRGAETEAFEREFATWTGAEHCVGVANGLDALRLVLQAWVQEGRLVEGDEVLVPANSFVASALAVTAAGLRVRLADVDSRTYNIDVDAVEAALTARTRVVMPVHLYGRLVDLSEIRDLCNHRGLLLLEDAAQAHGARSADSECVRGGAACFSFYPAKNLGALGDAGCVVTNDADLAARVRLLGNYGSTVKYQHLVQGCNSRIDEIQAAFLRVKLASVDADNQRRRHIAERYSRELSHPLVSTPELPPVATSHAWHLYVITTPRRRELAAHLERSGVETMIHYPRAIHRQEAYATALQFTNAPVADRLQEQVLSLPMSPVMTDAEVEYVVAAVNGWPRREDRV